MKSNSELIFQRAKKVIPGGIYGHVAPAAGLPDCFPHYCKKANGYKFEDVDGKEWIDFMCGFGAINLWVTLGLFENISFTNSVSTVIGR